MFNRKKFVIFGAILSVVFILSSLIFLKKYNEVYVYSYEEETSFKVASNGKPLCLFIWSADCSSCIYSLYHINFLQKKFEEQGGKIILILADDNIGLRQRANAIFLRFNLSNLETYFDKDKKLCKKYRISALPTLIVFDSNFKIFKRVEGFVPWAQEQNLQEVLDVFKK